MYLYSGRYDTSSVCVGVREFVFDYSLSFQLSLPASNITVQNLLQSHSEDFEKEQTQIGKNYSLNSLRTLLNVFKSIKYILLSIIFFKTYSINIIYKYIFYKYEE